MFNLVTSTSRNRRRRRRRRLWVFPEANLLLYTVCTLTTRSARVCYYLHPSPVCFPRVYNLEPFRIMIDNQQWGEWMYHIRVLFQTNSERRRRFQYSISACTAISLGSIFFSFLFLVRVLDWIPFQLSPRVPGRTVSERLIHQHLRHRSLSLTVTYLEASLNTHLGVTFSLSFSLWIP